MRRREFGGRLVMLLLEAIWRWLVPILLAQGGVQLGVPLESRHILLEQIDARLKALEERGGDIGLSRGRVGLRLYDLRVDNTCERLIALGSGGVAEDRQVLVIELLCLLRVKTGIRQPLDDSLEVLEFLIGWPERFERLGLRGRDVADTRIVSRRLGALERLLRRIIARLIRWNLGKPFAMSLVEDVGERLQILLRLLHQRLWRVLLDGEQLMIEGFIRLGGVVVVIGQATIAVRHLLLLGSDGREEVFREAEVATRVGQLLVELRLVCVRLIDLRLGSAGGEQRSEQDEREHRHPE